MHNTELNTLSNKISLFQQGNIPADLRTLQSFQSLLEEHFREVRSPAFFSERIGVSLLRLNKIAQCHLGMTVYEVMQNRLHLEALKLLRFTCLSVKEITYELGMDRPSYFCRHFRRLMGMSPLEYREWSRGQIPASVLGDFRY